MDIVGATIKFAIATGRLDIETEQPNNMRHFWRQTFLGDIVSRGQPFHWKCDDYLSHDIHFLLIQIVGSQKHHHMDGSHLVAF